MRVLFADQTGEIGGAQLCLLDLIPAVFEQGWEAVAAVPSEGPLAARLSSMGVEVCPLEIGSYSSGRKTMSDAARFAGRILRLARYIDTLCIQQRIELVYVNGPRLLPAVALSSYQAPVLFHAHSYLPHFYARRMATWAIRLRRASVAAVSRFVASQYSGWAKLQIIPNGVADLSRPRRGNAAPCIGMLGRVAPEKGHLVFLEAAKLLLQSMPQCRFVVCGSPSKAEPTYEEEVRRRARGLPVNFTGWRDDIAAMLAELDVLVVPSHGLEAFGRVVIEALSAGVPVVAFASGGIPELIDDGVTGFLVRPSTASALAAKLEAVLGDPQLRGMVAARARAIWESDYKVTLYRHRMVEAMARAAEPATGSPR